MSAAIKKILAYIQLQHLSHPKNGYCLTYIDGYSPQKPPALRLVESLELADYWHV